MHSLVSSTEVKDDGRTIVFSLCSGVKWHDGRDLHRSDAVFSMEYALKYPPVLALFPREVTFRPEGDRRLIAELTTPDSTMLGKLGRCASSPSTSMPKLLILLPFPEPAAFIGTGPFKLDSTIKNTAPIVLWKTPCLFGPALRYP